MISSSCLVFFYSLFFLTPLELIFLIHIIAIWTALHMGIEHNRPTKNISFFLIEFCPWEINYSEVEVVSSKPIFEWRCLVPPVAPGSGNERTPVIIFCVTAKFQQPNIISTLPCSENAKIFKRLLRNHCLLMKTLFLMSRVVGYVFKCRLPHTARRGSSFMKEDRLIRFI